MDPSITPSFEEQRLVNQLPGTTVPAPVLIMTASGFDSFGPQFIDKLCGVPKAVAAGKKKHDDDDDDDGDGKWKVKPPSSYKNALRLVKEEGHDLWRAAVDRAQGRKVKGDLPRSDDRPLYWARLTMSKALRQWTPSFAMTPEQRTELLWQFDRAARGQYDIKFPEGHKYKRIIVSGFDPFSLGAPGSTTSTGIRIGNPSGANALSLDGNRVKLADGSWAAVETYVLPVNYPEFMLGMVEDTVAPFYAATARRGHGKHRKHHHHDHDRGKRHGHDDDDDDDDDGGGKGAQSIHASISVSQGGGFQFWLEHWNGRFHGPSSGNDGIALCPSANGARLPANDDCDVYPPERWLGYDPKPWQKHNPPQFTVTSLPVASMIAARTQDNLPRPPGVPEGTEAFIVIWHTNYQVFPDCNLTQTMSRNNPPPVEFPPPTLPIPPGAEECARSGGGGDYLSNEVAYRNTLMRDTFGLSIPAGHIHVPVMTRFGTATNPNNNANPSVITDPTFEAYRDAIVEQTRRLIFVAAQNLREGAPPHGVAP